METRNTILRVASLVIALVVVRVVHHAVGFKYALFAEGIFNMKFLIDFVSSLVVYAVISFLVLKVFSRNTTE